MDKQKRYKKNYGIPFFAMTFLAATAFEFYWIMTDPYAHFMLIGIGLIMLITGYLTIDSILAAKADSDAKREEQNDMLLKAQKAIYIATKKNAKDAEIRQSKSVKIVELMMNKMITTQQALLEDKKPDSTNKYADMTALIDQLSESNAKLAKEVQAAITVNELVKANADLVKNVKEALNASAMNSSVNSIDLNAYVAAATGTTNTAQATATQTTATQAFQTAPIAPETPISSSIPEPAMNNASITESETIIDTTSILEPEAVIDTSFVTEPESAIDTTSILEPEAVIDTTSVSEPEAVIDTTFVAEAEATINTTSISDPEVTIDTSDNFGFDLNEFDMSSMPEAREFFDNTMTDMENEINLAKMAEIEALENITFPEEMTSELDATIDDGSDLVIDTMTANDAQATEEATKEATESNPFTATANDSPNRQLTEEEIAALFASL